MTPRRRCGGHVPPGRDPEVDDIGAAAQRPPLRPPRIGSDRHAQGVCGVGGLGQQLGGAGAIAISAAGPQCVRHLGLRDGDQRSVVYDPCGLDRPLEVTDGQVGLAERQGCDPEHPFGRSQADDRERRHHRQVRERGQQVVAGRADRDVAEGGGGLDDGGHPHQPGARAGSAPTPSATSASSRTRARSVCPARAASGPTSPGTRTHRRPAWAMTPPPRPGRPARCPGLGSSGWPAGGHRGSRSCRPPRPRPPGRSTVRPPPRPRRAGRPAPAA